jgi:anti-sigma-K factor RskA
MTAERVCDLAEAYAIGALAADEASDFERHLADCPDCPRTVRAQREVGVLLAQAVAAEPRPELRQRLLAAVRASEATVRPLRPRRPWPRVLALAAAVAGVLLGGVQTVRLARLSGALRQLGDSLQSREHRLAEVLAQRNAILNDDIRMYYLAAQDPAAGRAGAQIYWSRANRSWLVHAFNLPSLSGNRVYQLWYVTADAKISAGILEPDPEGHAVMVTRVPAEASAATLGAISIEPSGGSAQPTGPIVLAGSVAERS